MTEEICCKCEYYLCAEDIYNANIGSCDAKFCKLATYLWENMRDDLSNRRGFKSILEDMCDGTKFWAEINTELKNVILKKLENFCGQSLDGDK